MAHPFFFESGLTSCRQDSFSCVLVYFVYIVSDRIHDLAVYLKRTGAVLKATPSADKAYAADTKRVGWTDKVGALVCYARYFRTLLPITKASHGTHIPRSLGAVVTTPTVANSCWLCMQCRLCCCMSHDVWTAVSRC